MPAIWKKRLSKLGGRGLGTTKDWCDIYVAFTRILYLSNIIINCTTLRRYFIATIYYSYYIFMWNLIIYFSCTWLKRKILYLSNIIINCTTLRRYFIATIYYSYYIFMWNLIIYFSCTWLKCMGSFIKYARIKLAIGSLSHWLMTALNRPVGHPPGHWYNIV